MECHHRTLEFTKVLIRVFGNLKKVFQTKQHCYLLSCTGTGALEASLIHCLSPQDRLLFINAGKFGQRWGDLTRAYGLESKDLEMPWGMDIDLEAVERELKTGLYRACAFQACETSTGALLPVADLGKLCQKYGVFSIVDAITALGAVNLPMDEWGLDVVVGGSQKAFMLPTGLSFISLSEKVQEVNSSIPSFYFDLKAEKRANLEGKTRYSTATHFVLALDQVLHHILDQVGLEKHFQRMVHLATLFRDHVELELFAKTPSPSLSCLKVPETVSANRVRTQVEAQGYVIMGGQGPLDDKVLRVGHMGEMEEQDLVEAAQIINRFVQ